MRCGHIAWSKRSSVRAGCDGRLRARDMSEQRMPQMSRLPRQTVCPCTIVEDPSWVWMRHIAQSTIRKQATYPPQGHSPSLARKHALPTPRLAPQPQDYTLAPPKQIGRLRRRHPTHRTSTQWPHRPFQRLYPIFSHGSQAQAPTVRSTIPQPISPMSTTS